MASHKAPDTTATDVVPPPPKPFGGERAIATRPDISDPDQVFDLALVLRDAHVRRLFMTTHAEWRAVAAFAVNAGIIASHAAYLVTLSDADAPEPEIIAAMEALCRAVRGQ